MAATPESKTKAKVKKVLDAFGDDVYYFFPAMGTFGKSGVPDIIVCFHGLFVDIEVKFDSTKYKVTALQQKNLDEITAAGGLSLVIDEANLSTLQQQLESWRILKHGKI